MKVGFDGRYAEGNLAGIGKYIKYLTLGLAKSGVDCIIYYSKTPSSKINSDHIKQRVLYTKNKYIFEQLLLPRAIKQDNLDLYHATANTGIPVFISSPCVLTIHDIIPLTQENYFDKSKFPTLSKSIYFWRSITSAKQAKFIISVSNYVKGQVINNLNIQENKIKVIYSGVKPAANKKRLPFDLKNREYILNNGGIAQRKNLYLLINAFCEFSKKQPKVKLVITGDNIKLVKNLKELCKILKVEDKVIFTGYIDEKTLWKIIESAGCICLLSDNEGFGLPVIEGLTKGIPLILSNKSSYPEASGGFAFLVDEKNTKSVIKAMDKVFNGFYEKKMIKEGREYAKKFTWQRTVKETYSIYKAVLNSSR